MKKKLIKVLNFGLISMICLSNMVVANAATKYTTIPQDFTAYVWDDVTYPNRKAASGVSYEIGYCAVHPSAWGASNWNKPIVPFGTILTLSDVIYHPVGELSLLQVQDTGELNNEHNFSKYWVDVYWGTKDEYEESANKFGNPTYSYSYYK